MICSTDNTLGAVKCSDIEIVFQQCFFERFRVRLSGGHSEPLYLPAKGPGACAELRYRENYVSSALHEIAHWCIAGEERRKRVDFGYWYEPDGRSAKQQQAFEQVEIKPQALEWIFSRAAGIRFHISVDNLNNETQACSRVFSGAVGAQVLTYLDSGLPPRAGNFAEALADFFKSALVFDATHYTLPIPMKPMDHG